MAVNKFWMCDDGMVSYRAAHEGRVLEPTVDGKITVTSKALDAAKAAMGGAQDSIALVFSAQHSMEDNWALKELAKLLGTTSLYWAGAGEGYADDILINADKNSNTAGVKMLCPEAKPFKQLIDDLNAGKVAKVIALGGVAPTDAPITGGTIVAIAAHQGAFTKAAKVVLPATSWAEHSGTYVNFKGIKQVAEKAIEPQGASKPAWQQIAALARVLGFDAQWTKLKAIRSHLALDAAPPAAE
jgi:NADH-quinone oxidoreductase subunit G